MNNPNKEPVEISTRMRPGEWTAESLDALTLSYQQKLRDMGAAVDDIETAVQTPDDGSAHVHVSWLREGVHTFQATGPSTGQDTISEAEVSRGQGERIPAGETTEDAKGLGAVLGDAERSAIDEPPSARGSNAAPAMGTDGYVVRTDAQGETIVEDLGPDKT